MNTPNLIKSFLLAALLSPPLYARTGRKKAAPIISKITIQSSDVFNFDTRTYLNHFPYTWINIAHIKTKDYVLERELLFKVGDHVDNFLLEETERNLRALPYIQAARIAKFPRPDGTVEIVVYTSDAWTTEPQVNLGGQNKVSNVEMGLKEKNLLGFGKTLGVFYSKSPDVTQRTYSYGDSRLFGSRWALDGELISRTTGGSREVKLTHPFFATDTRWSALASHRVQTDVLGDFVNNVRVSEFEQTKQTNEVGGAVKIGTSRTIVAHAGPRYRKESTDYAITSKTDTTRPLLARKDLQTVFLDLDISRVKFIKMNHLEKMTRVEDVNLGPQFFASPGISPSALAFTEKKITDTLSMGLEKKELINDTHLFTEKFSYSGRDVTKNSVNNKYLTELRLYYRDPTLHTLVVNTRAEWGDALDPDNQIVLGSANGMRAYKVDQFNGNKSWVLNVEDRIYLLDDFLNLISVGAAAFYDMGYAWPEGHPVAMSDIRNSVGAGFRFGLTKSSNEPVVRLDISYRLRTVPGDSTRWVVTFGSGQAF